MLDEISSTLDLTAARLESAASDAPLAERLTSLAQSLASTDGDTAAEKRKRGLAATLTGLAARLR